MHHEQHHHIFHYFLNRELSEIYTTIAIRTFAIGLISIFIPIYLLQKGYVLKEIFLFFIVYFGLFALLSFFIAKISVKIGIKHSILISMPLLILFYIFLNFVNELNWAFFLTASLASIQASFFWINFHTDFKKFSKKRLRTRQLGFVTILCSALAALGPIAGGFLLNFFSFTFVFILVCFLLFTAMIPLFLSKEIHEPKKVSFKKEFKNLNTRNATGFFGYGLITVVLATVWPIFIFLILKG